MLRAPSRYTRRYCSAPPRLELAQWITASKGPSPFNVAGLDRSQATIGKGVPSNSPERVPPTTCQPAPCKMRAVARPTYPHPATNTFFTEAVHPVRQSAACTTLLARVRL